jgi:MSHA biogenesis protein MshJ
MMAQWRAYSERFGALTIRERVIVLVAAVAGTALVFDALAIQPLQARRKILERQVVETRENVRLAETALRARETVPDPDAVKRSYRDVLRKQLAEIDQSMKGLQKGLVPPEKMARLLEDMLERSRGLQLVSLRTLPTERFEAPGAAPAQKPAAKGAKAAPPPDPERTLYRHGVELTLQGSYPDLLEYLTQLEKLPWQMFWGRITMNTEQYPRLRVTLTVQTLSLNKAWLVV